MVPVSSSCPPSRAHTCSRAPALSLSPHLANSPVKGLSVLEIKVLNGKFRCPGVETASDLHVCHKRALKRVQCKLQ